MDRQRTVPILLSDDADVRATLREYQRVQQHLSNRCYNRGKPFGVAVLERMCGSVALRTPLAEPMKRAAARQVGAAYARARGEKLPGPLAFAQPSATFRAGEGEGEAAFYADGTLSIWTLAGRKRLTYALPPQVYTAFMNAKAITRVTVAPGQGCLLGQVTLICEDAAQRPAPSAGDERRRERFPPWRRRQQHPAARLLNQARAVFAAWGRVLALIWRTNPRHILLLLLLTIALGALPSAQISVTSLVVQSASDAIRGGHTQELVSAAVFFALLQGGVAGLSTLLGLGQQLLQSLVQLEISNEVSLRIMTKAAELDLQFFEDDTCYDQMQRATRESLYRPYQVLTQMLDLCSEGVTLISVTAVLLTWNWWMAPLVLLAPLPAVGAQLFYGQRAYQIERARAPERRRLSYLQFLVTNARAVKEIRLFRLGPYFLDRYRRMYADFYAIDSALAKRQAWVQLPFTLLTLAVSVGLQLYALLVTIAAGRIGLLVALTQSIGLVQSTVHSFLGDLSQLYQHNLYVSNLFEFLDIAPCRVRSGTRAVPDQLRLGIEFRHVSFRYPGTSDLVLRDLSLVLRAGECVALVGQNGAGKTTLVKLLTRLYEPSGGQILLDGIPLEEYDLTDLRRHVSAIYQDFVQYEMTARENIGFGSLERLSDEQRLRWATEQSGADAVVRRLPLGWASVLGRMFEQGQELSIGQWQKIALARAFMSRAPIVVLDEPTSAIDAEAETEIFGRLKRIAAGATALLIAHRFSTVRMADRILVLERGQVSEEGTHEELLSAGGTYARLFRLQAAGYVDQQGEAQPD